VTAYPAPIGEPVAGGARVPRTIARRREDHWHCRAAAFACKQITMTDYLGSQAWCDELMDLLRANATPPFAAVIAGTDQGMTYEEIAERWRELGGRAGRGPGVHAP